jgi:hypothetical protein
VAKHRAVRRVLQDEASRNVGKRVAGPVCHGGETGVFRWRMRRMLNGGFGNVDGGFERSSRTRVFMGATSPFAFWMVNRAKTPLRTIFGETSLGTMTIIVAQNAPDSLGALLPCMTLIQTFRTSWNSSPRLGRPRRGLRRLGDPGLNRRIRIQNLSI